MSDLTAFSKLHTAARLRAAATRGTLSHALIFSGAGDRAAAALYTAAALECVSDTQRPCLACAHCRKVMAQIHPDVAFVRDPDHKDVSTEVVRATRADAFIRPNEGGRKVYIFEDCSLLTEKDQNILLKIVEEGPPYCAFLFCTESSAALLPTVRSRCVEVKLGEEGAEAEPTQRRDAARKLCRLSLRGSAAQRAAFLVSLELDKATKREELGGIFEDARLLFACALTSLYAPGGADEDAELIAALAGAFPRTKLLAIIDLLDAYRRHCSYNVGVGHTLGGFAAEWEEALK